jgi:hypothetical protein
MTRPRQDNPDHATGTTRRTRRQPSDASHITHSVPHMPQVPRHQKCPLTRRYSGSRGDNHGHGPAPRRRRPIRDCPLPRARNDPNRPGILHADMTIKQRALDRAAPPGCPTGRYHRPDALIVFLDGL